MRKLLACAFTLMAFNAAFAQTTTPNKNVSAINRAGDHFMIQLAANSWQGAADSVKDATKGLNRSANVYIMFNKPFKGDPRFAAAVGLGVGTSNIYFDNLEARIGSNVPVLPFVRTDTGNNYKKYKLSTAYLELPIELRFSSKPDVPNKSLKGAIGVKVGTILNAHTKGKNLQTASGGSINESTFKESNKSYFNTTRLVATARVGYGLFSLFGAYNITNIFKDGVAADTKLLQVGLTISGL